MALSTAQQNVISQAFQQAYNQLVQFVPIGNIINNEFNGASNWNNTIQQSDLDAWAPASGLTVAQLQGLVYALTLIFNQCNTSLAPLTEGATRALNKF